MTAHEVFDEIHHFTPTQLDELYAMYQRRGRVLNMPPRAGRAHFSIELTTTYIDHFTRAGSTPATADHLRTALEEQP